MKIDDDECVYNESSTLISPSRLVSYVHTLPPYPKQPYLCTRYTQYVSPYQLGASIGLAGFKRVYHCVCGAGSRV